jgi:hypothetical protein|tara:strand:- start:402 stop:908 length:507 start_codon:yes stop_codon:yes gene_type:complete
MKKIELTWQEFESVAETSLKQVFSSWKKSSKDYHGFIPKTFFDETIISRGAEMAVAKATNRYWDGAYDTYKKSADVGKNIEVRYCTFKNPSLQLRPNSDEINKDRVFFLVTSDFKIGELPLYCIHGYIKGEDGMKEEFLTDFGYDGINKKPKRPKCWAIPNSKLKPLS